ncbi:hypothetical protein P886_1283 [Alteromonadaceae bacterium 2753L.S.0a.02]|nr:hypothetical protein P886_1283 [Alteromonadaceae bacterium 2753L.S.0a.02]
MRFLGLLLGVCYVGWLREGNRVCIIGVAFRYRFRLIALGRKVSVFALGGNLPLVVEYLYFAGLRASAVRLGERVRRMVSVFKHGKFLSINIVMFLEQSAILNVHKMVENLDQRIRAVT